MQFSRFLVIRELSSDIVALYNSLCPKPLFFTKTAVDNILSGNSSDRVHRLLSDHYCLSSCDDELFARYAGYNQETNGKIDTLYIVLTTNCNLDCDYCAVKDMADSNKSVMSEETIKHVIKLFFQYCKNTGIEYSQICFYGGEPLIAFDRLRFTVMYCKALGFNTCFSVVSNGTNVNREQAKFIKENKISISISLDGPQHINDVNRLFHGSRTGTYESAIKGLTLLSSYGCSVGLSLTITESILKHEEEVIKWIKSLPISGVYCNLLHSSKLPLHDMISLYERSAVFCSRIERETRIQEGRFSRRFNSFISSDFMFSDCAAVGINQITVDPYGNIYFCHCARAGSPAENVNKIQTLVSIIPSEQSNPWYAFSPIARETCFACPGISICGGGCYGMNAYNSEIKKDIPYCHYTLKTLDVILGQILAKNGVETV